MKKVLVVICITKDESMTLAKEVSGFLKEKNIKFDFINFDGFSDDTSFEEYSAVITLGGDGTVLYAARNCVAYDIPVFAINLGEFGFLATIEKNEWKEKLDAFFDNKLAVNTRSMMSVSLYRDGQCIVNKLGLNDLVINAKNSAKTVSLGIDYKNIHLCNLKADGVIFSTSTGSTAYSAAAGGPIVAPDLNAFVMTPINAFSLSSRPIVLGMDGEICIEIQPCRTKEINMIVDGQDGIPLKFNDKIIIVENTKKVKLVSCDEENFYEALRSKLNWTGGPHA